jgi:hypothetical protein
MFKEIHDFFALTQKISIGRHPHSEEQHRNRLSLANDDEEWSGDSDNCSSDEEDEDQDDEEFNENLEGFFEPPQEHSLGTRGEHSIKFSMHKISAQWLVPIS